MCNHAVFSVCAQLSSHLSSKLVIEKMSYRQFRSVEKLKNSEGNFCLTITIDQAVKDGLWCKHSLVVLAEHLGKKVFPICS